MTTAFNIILHIIVIGVRIVICILIVVGEGDMCCNSVEGRGKCVLKLLDYSQLALGTLFCV